MASKLRPEGFENLDMRQELVLNRLVEALELGHELPVEVDVPSND